MSIALIGVENLGATVVDRDEATSLVDSARRTSVPTR